MSFDHAGGHSICTEERISHSPNQTPFDPTALTSIHPSEESPPDKACGVLQRTGNEQDRILAKLKELLGSKVAVPLFQQAPCSLYKLTGGSGEFYPLTFLGRVS